jgi:hypothetical protein
MKVHSKGNTAIKVHDKDKYPTDPIEVSDNDDDDNITRTVVVLK